MIGEILTTAVQSKTMVPTTENLTDLFICPLSHTHHEEEQPCEADSLHCCDEEKSVGLEVMWPHCHLPQFCQGQGTEARSTQMLSQAETKRKQRQAGGYQPT